MYISKDGHTLLAVDNGGSILLWDLTNPRRLPQADQIDAGRPEWYGSNSE